MWRHGGLILLCAALTTGCAGYRLGPTNGQVAGEKSIQVNLFQNETLEPRLTEAVGTALRRVLQQDGTYRLNTRGDADVVVSGTITEYRRAGISYQPRDIITPRDFQITLVAKVTATDRTSGRQLLDRPVRGRTTVRLVADPTGTSRVGDVNTAERQAVPLVAEDLARNVTSLLVDGTW